MRSSTSVCVHLVARGGLRPSLFAFLRRLATRSHFPLPPAQNSENVDEIMLRFEGTRMTSGRPCAYAGEEHGATEGAVGRPEIHQHGGKVKGVHDPTPATSQMWPGPSRPTPAPGTLETQMTSLTMGTLILGIVGNRAADGGAADNRDADGGRRIQW